MKFLKILIVLSTGLFSAAAFSAPQKVYHCVGNILTLEMTSIDRGRTYPDEPYTFQHTYDLTYKVQLRKDGSIVLQGKERTQAYVDNDMETWSWGCAENPKGGGMDQPLDSIWFKTNDRDVINAVYYRNPYNMQKMNCERIR